MHLDLCCWGNKRPFGGRACPAFFFFILFCCLLVVIVVILRQILTM